MQGTSMATPTCAGGTSLVRQYFVDGWYPSGVKNPADTIIPSASLVKAIIINGGENIPGSYSGSSYPGCANVSEDAPALGQGWGRMHLENSLYFSGDSSKLVLWDINNAGGVGTGQQHMYGLTVTTGSLPLKVTLVWTDPPAAINCNPCLVDNLDLEITDPSGTYYRGNQFSGSPKESTQNPSGTDLLNNVEGILVSNPVPGDWILKVTGTNVPGKPPVTTQGYAIVVTGDVSPATASCSAPVFGGVQSVSDVNICANNGIRINWSPPTSWGIGATSGTYDLRRYTTADCSGLYDSVATSLPAATTTFTDTSAEPGMTYHYQVVATNNCPVPMSSAGTNSCSAAIMDDADVIPCPDVANALLVAKSGTNARLTWTAVICSDLAWYRVYGSTSFGAIFPGGWTLLGAPTGTVFNNPLSSNYRAYKVIPIDACGN